MSMLPMSSNDLHTSPTRRRRFFPSRNPFSFPRLRPGKTVDSSGTTSSAGSADPPRAESEPHDLTESWISVRLPRDVLKVFLEYEIIEWLREHRLETTGLTVSQKPWYRGYYRGVRLDKLIPYYCRLLRETWRTNPYGIGAWLYFIMLVAYTVFVLGNIIVGFLEGKKQRETREGNGVLPVLKGVLAAMPVAWMLPIFLCPPLIANVQDQFAAHGYYNINFSATANKKQH